MWMWSSPHLFLLNAEHAAGTLTLAGLWPCPSRAAPARPANPAQCTASVRLIGCCSSMQESVGETHESLTWRARPPHLCLAPHPCILRPGSPILPDGNTWTKTATPGGVFGGGGNAYPNDWCVRANNRLTYTYLLSIKRLPRRACATLYSIQQKNLFSVACARSDNHAPLPVILLSSFLCQ